MIAFLSELRKRNKILYKFGWLCMLGALTSILFILIDNTIVAGINAWIKPLKFFLSIAIFSWTMGWLLYYLQYQKKVRAYSWAIVIIMAFELFVIVWQAANGRLSHYNISTPLYMWLFQFMGIAIVTITLWTAYIAYLFFRQKQFTISETYLWGIRLGMIFFVIFSFEGGLMAYKLQHTVGNPDGGPGLPLLNWSKEYGDLRVAHFFGLHSLQVLPIFGYYLAAKKWQMFLFSFLYVSFIVAKLVQAINKIPFIG